MAHPYLICSPPARCGRWARRGWPHTTQLPEKAPSPAGSFGGTISRAPTMLGCPRLALLCALPWLVRAAVPGHRAEPLGQSAEPLRDPRDPARGADFDRVYSGVVSLSTEDIYSFNHTSHPGQVRSSLPPLTPTSEVAKPPRCHRCTRH